MTQTVVPFLLTACLMIGALLTLAGAVVTADSRRWASDLGMDHTIVLTRAMSMGVAGLLIFIAAACAILRTIAGA
ncbi:hypothetical protein [Sphingomonas sp.]|uniref:hypothetical protein n=1 Tax=Sphingomonas sp. TaxID=28214 RepID=UPI0025D6EE4B|nr:hypothetical protein [Sphingomonas sp.]